MQVHQQYQQQRSSPATQANPHISQPVILANQQAEYKKQAAEAYALLQRLHELHMEAERAAKQEIAQTEAMLEREASSHAEVSTVRRQIAELETRLREWNTRRPQELARLRAEGAQVSCMEEERRAEVRRMKALEEEWTRKESYLNAETARINSELDRIRNEMGDPDKLGSRYQENLTTHQSLIDQAKRSLELLQLRVNDTRQAWERAKQAQLSAHDDFNRQLALLDNINRDVGVCGNELNAAMNALRQAQEARADAESQLKALNGQWRDLQDLKNSISDKMSSAQHELNEALALRQQNDQKMQELRAEIHRLAPEKDRLAAQSLSLSQQIVQLQAQKQQVDRDLEQARERVRPFELDLQRHSDLTGSIQEQVFMAQNNFAAINEQYNGVVERFSAVQVQLDAFQKAFEDAEKRISGFGPSVDALQVRSTDLAKQQKRQAEIVDRARNELDQVGRTLNKAELDLAQTEREQRDVEERLARLLEELTGHRGTLASFNSRMDGLRAQMDELRNLLAGFDEQRRQLNAARQASSADYDRLRRDLIALDDRINQLEAEVQRWTFAPNFEQERHALLRQLRVKEQEVVARLRVSPSQAIQRQLERESGAVLRAEAAAAVENRQKAIYEDADGLARLRFIRNPRIELDLQAQTALLAEHASGIPRHELAQPTAAPYRVQHDREIAQRVINLTEDHHIRTTEGTISA